MIDIILTVNKEKRVYEGIKTTSYTGAKMDDELAYDRIFTTDEDKSMLERFGAEVKNTIYSLKKMAFGQKRKLTVNTGFRWGCRIHSMKL